MVPPSCSTSQREDAVEAEQMLRYILTSPADAAERHAPVDTSASGTMPDRLLVSHRIEMCLYAASAYWHYPHPGLQDNSHVALVCSCAATYGLPARKHLWSCRATAWRQQILERVCRPSLDSLGQLADIVGDQHADDDLEIAAKNQSIPKAESRQVHATGRRHRRSTDENPLQSPAWDKHCTASMLAGMLPHLLKMPSASLYSRECSDCASAMAWSCHVAWCL